MADPIFAFARRLAQGIEIGMKTVAENAALLQRERRVVDKCFGQLLSEYWHFVKSVLQMGPKGRM